MGLIGAFIAYRHGRNKERRRAERQQREFEDSIGEAFDVCDHCGHMRMQHDDAGRCPNYG